jgi:ABC-2 type transport system ATP-binding protein
MIQKKIQCPNCDAISSTYGDIGDVIRIKCPACGITGKVTFQNNYFRSEDAIEVYNLKKVYGDLVAVNGINFSVKKGEVFAFLGPNGAGKTTTVEMIESIRKPTAGTIKILGNDINNSFNDIKEKIGILPQEFRSFEKLTVRETLFYYSKFYKKRANIDDILDAMDLRFYENILYKDLSGGLKQRVGVAISLVNDPDIVFLDEPTTGLDPKARREVWEVISGLRDSGKTIFLTTHYMEEAEYLADHIAVIHKGNIIAEGTVDDLINRYGSGNILNIKNCKTSDAIQIFKNNGFEAFKKGNGEVSVKIINKDQIFEILSLLRRDCVDYSTIDIRRSNLEEVFLHLTGSKLTGGSAS